jgi:hypothetical protein
MTPGVFLSLLCQTVVPLDILQERVWQFVESKRHFLALLSPADTATIMSLLHVSQADTVTSEEQLENEGVARLLGVGFLRDYEMNIAFESLRSTLSENVLSVRQQDKILILGVWFQQKHGRLNTVSDQKRLKILKNHHPKRDNPIWDWNIVLLPGFTECHWYLGVIDFTVREFRYYDSHGVRTGHQYAWSTFQLLQVRCFSTPLPTPPIEECQYSKKKYTLGIATVGIRPDRL